ncbi:MAG: DRTGG domain-containing protein [Bacillota bacterium]
MTVREIVEQLDLEIVVANDLDREVSGGYTGDLLSNVMARGEAGNIWLTIQGHQNVVAVALLTEMSAVVVVEGFEMDDQALDRAREKGINILYSRKKAFELAGQLYRLGLR